MERDHLFYMANLGVEARRFWNAKKQGNEKAANESRERMERPLQSLSQIFAGTSRAGEFQALSKIICTEHKILRYFDPFIDRMSRKMGVLA